MSASTMPTLRPCLAIARARLTVTEDLPTPPLPLAIAKTLVSEPGWAKGISRWAWPPRRVCCRLGALLGGHHAEREVDAGDARRPRPTAAVTSRVMVSFSGQPATVSRTVRRDLAGVVDVDGLDHAEVGDRALDLGVVDGRQGGVDLLDSRGAHDARS